MSVANPAVSPLGVPPAASQAAQPVMGAGGALAETAALNAFLKQVTGLILPRLASYLKEHAPSHEQLAPCIPLLTQAVERYKAGAFGEVFWGCFAVYRYVLAVREQSPDLPEIELGGDAG
jgi:hypothetical protein